MSDWCRGAFSYVKRVTQKKGKAEFAAKFISARGKRKALALREMDLLSELDNERILYFHDAFEKKNMVVIITELYPFNVAYSQRRERLQLLFLPVESRKRLYFSCSAVSNLICFVVEQKCTYMHLKDTKDPEH